MFVRGMVSFLTIVISDVQNVSVNGKLKKNKKDSYRIIMRCSKMIKTAEQLCDENWSSSKQWSVHRKGTKDGIVVLLSNPPWGRLRSPFVDFLVFKDGKEVGHESSYKDVREKIKQLKQEVW